MSRRFSTIVNNNRKFWYELYTDAITNKSNTYSRELFDSSRKEMIPYILASFGATTALVLFSHSETNTKIDNTNTKLAETNVKLAETNIKIAETNIKIAETNIKIAETNTKLDTLLELTRESNSWRFF